MLQYFFKTYFTASYAFNMPFVKHKLFKGLVPLLFGIVTLSKIASFNWTVVKFSSIDNNNAATPVTYGAAIEVPDILWYPFWWCFEEVKSSGTTVDPSSLYQ